jgi:hypothetical protein
MIASCLAQTFSRVEPMDTTKTTPLEPGNRVQLPADWAEALGLDRLVILDRTAQGILVRPHPATTWDEIFATKLTIGSAPADANQDSLEVTGDDLLFG